MQAVRYRPEIDGLRAVAVLSVIIFHLNNRWLPGGFLGVDIFFVISGFLITGIILSEIQNGSFSFRDFYTRRIKRIYPAFIAAVSLASVIASQIFLYEDFNQMRKTIELSTVFLSNIYFGVPIGVFRFECRREPRTAYLVFGSRGTVLPPVSSFADILLQKDKIATGVAPHQHHPVPDFDCHIVFTKQVLYRYSQPTQYLLPFDTEVSRAVGRFAASGLRANAKRQTANSKWKTAVAFITLLRRIACLPVRD